MCGQKDKHKRITRFFLSTAFYHIQSSGQQSHGSYVMVNPSGLLLYQTKQGVSFHFALSYGKWDDTQKKNFQCCMELPRCLYVLDNKTFIRRNGMKFDSTVLL